MVAALRPASSLLFYSAAISSRGSKACRKESLRPIQPFSIARAEAVRALLSSSAGWPKSFGGSGRSASQLARPSFNGMTSEHGAKFLQGDTHSSLKLQTGFRPLNSELCLLPIYNPELPRTATRSIATSLRPNRKMRATSRPVADSHALFVGFYPGFFFILLVWAALWPSTVQGPRSNFRRRPEMPPKHQHEA